MEKSVKGQMRELRRACKTVGFQPTNLNNPTEKNRFPITGTFSVQRDGKDVAREDVRLGDTIVVATDPMLVKQLAL